MADLLIVAMVALAARLVAVLTSARRLPAFRLFLFVWVVRMLCRVWTYSSVPWFDGAVLALKVVVTVESVWLLCRGLSRRESKWLVLSSLLFVAAGTSITNEAGIQANLPAPMLVFVKHSIQHALAIFALTVNLYVWKYDPYTGDDRHIKFDRLHGWTLTAYWWAYALAGMVVPQTRSDWDLFNLVFYVAAIPALLLWIEGANGVSITRPPSQPVPRFVDIGPQAAH